MESDGDADGDQALDKATAFQSGLLLLGNTWAAALVLPWVIAIFMLVGGIFAIFMSFRLKSAGA